MEFEELKKLVKNKERIILVEEGKPSFVLLSFEDYKKIVGLNPGKEESEKEDISQKEEGKKESSQGEDLTLEDLPL